MTYFTPVKKKEQKEQEQEEPKSTPRLDSSDKDQVPNDIETFIHATLDQDFYWSKITFLEQILSTFSWC